MIGSKRRGTPHQKRIGGWVAVAAAFVAIGFFGFQLYQNWQFEGPVAHTQATVDQLSYTYGRRTYPVVAFHYFDEQGHSFSQDKIVRKSTWDRLRSGGPLPIKYLPEHPAVCRVDLPEEERSAVTKLYPMPVLIAALFGFGWYSLWSAKRDEER